MYTILNRGFNIEAVRVDEPKLGNLTICKMLVKHY